jgi:hypothetical protein
MITAEDYFGHQSHVEEPAQEVRDNAAELLPRVNTLLARAAAEGIECAATPKLNSGWRPAAYNATVPGAALHSKHITGQAADIGDPDGLLDDWCVRNLEVLADIGLWLEHPLSTKGWTHVQCVPPRSGNRVFYP